MMALTLIGCSWASHPSSSLMTGAFYHRLIIVGPWQVLPNMMSIEQYESWIGERKTGGWCFHKEFYLLGMFTGEVSDLACSRDATGQGESWWEKRDRCRWYCDDNIVSTARSCLGANVHFKVKNQPIYPFRPHNTCTSWSSRVVLGLEGLRWRWVGEVSTQTPIWTQCRVWKGPFHDGQPVRQFFVG